MFCHRLGLRFASQESIPSRCLFAHDVVTQAGKKLTLRTSPCLLNSVKLRVMLSRKVILRYNLSEVGLNGAGLGSRL